MVTSSRSSGNLLADRRFGYAEGLLADGDPIAAADLLEQTIALVPDWVPAWLALGLARERTGEASAAGAAFAEAAARDSSGVYGARLHLARLRGGAADMSPAFVAALFDDYAPRFDKHLVEDLGYCGPALLVAALTTAAPGRRFARALDLGCGTGLMGVAIRSLVERLVGVDLSAAMVAVAAARSGLYDDLAVGDLERFLDSQTPESCDIVVAADVFVYIGPIDRTLVRVARVLRPGGLLAFTVQRGTDDDLRLGSDMRFSHAPAFVATAIAGAGLDPVLSEDASTRRDAGLDVPGLVVVVRKP